MQDRDIELDFKDKYRYANEYWSPFLEDARVYTLAASGYTWSNQERQMLQKQGREPLELNIMRRPLQFFSGYLRDNINQVIYSPVEGSDQKTADQFTKLSYYIWDKGQGYPTFLDACDECFKSGISLCGIQMDYSKDFINGDITFFKRTYNSFLLDPTFESIDLRDCGFAITRDLVSRDYAKMLLKEVSASEIDDIPMAFKDDKFMSFHPQFTTLSRNRDILAYDQYYERTTRTREFIVDKDTGYFQDITDKSRDEKATLREGLKRIKRLHEVDKENIAASNVEIQTIERPYVKLHVMLNGIKVFSGEDSTGINETFPFVPNICYMEPSIWMPSQRIQGMASCQWSAQRSFNKRHMKIENIMDSVVSTGYKYLIGSVADVSDLQQTGQGRIIGVDPENAPQGLDSVQELRGGDVPASLLEYQNILNNLTLTLGNVTEASLGMDEKRNTLVSGRLAQVQIAQNLMSNRKVFDNIDTAQQVLGGLILTAIQKKYPPSKIERIINETPTEQFYEEQFEQYDAVIKEGVRSRSQKDAYYYELVNLKRDGIVNVSEERIIDALQMTGGDDIREDAQRAQEAQQAQQQKVDAQEQMALELANSQKEENLALAQSRRARVLGEIGLYEERISESEQNRAQAALDRAKTITEIASMKEDRLLKVLGFVNMLEAQERANQEQKEQKAFNTADAINSETDGSFENNQLKAQVQQQQQMTQEPTVPQM